MLRTFSVEIKFGRESSQHDLLCAENFLVIISNRYRYSPFYDTPRPPALSNPPFPLPPPHTYPVPSCDHPVPPALSPCPHLIPSRFPLYPPIPHPIPPAPYLPHPPVAPAPYLHPPHPVPPPHTVHLRTSCGYARELSCLFRDRCLLMMRNIFLILDVVVDPTC